MTLRSNPRVLTSTLLAALGLVPSACGGESRRLEDDGAGGESGSHTASGGSGSTSANGGTSSAGTLGLGGSSPTAITGGSPSTGGTTFQGNPFPCVDPVDVGAGTSGFVLCASGAKHRPSIETCPVAVPRAGELPDLPGATCSSDLDCQDMPYGFCADGFGEEGATRYCQYGCATDADCPQQAICECGEFVGSCIGATCASDADCIPEYFCQTHDPQPGCSGIAYACQRPLDSCGSDADCTPQTVCSAGVNSDQTRTCVPRSCTPGRPFLVGGALRVARAVERSDWLACGEWPDVSMLPTELRERAGAWYRECAALEHASVASFARFTLGLLAVGAPSDLVAESVYAMNDELEHARVTYALASHFLGRPVGPGALCVDTAFEGAFTLDELALSTFVEGCMGETLGALEVREAAAHAVDPVLRAALERIADDEARHAALAFRFVAWALERSVAGLRQRLEAAFEAARGELDPRSGAEFDSELSAYGVLGEAMRRAVRGQALEHVVGPCVAALLAKGDLGHGRANSDFANA